MDITQQLWLLKQIYTGYGSYYDADKDLHLHRIPSGFMPEDLQALEICRHAPNQMLRFEHDAVLSELRKLSATWTLQEAAGGFLAALWAAPFFWGSAVTGKLLADQMPEHNLTPYSSSSDVCQICGIQQEAEDTTLAWYYAMTSGTPLDGNPTGHVLALREMQLMEQRPQVSEYDRWTFRAILTVIRNLPPQTRYSKVREALYKEKLLPIKKQWAYTSLLETLALIGVLDTPDYPGLATVFTTYKKREERPSPRMETQAPLAWWDSSIGVNEQILKTIFSDFDCSSVEIDEQRPSQVPPLVETVTGALEKQRLPRAKVPKSSADPGSGPVQAGDVYAIRIRDGVWVTAYCHEVQMKDTIRARMEYLDGILEQMPTKDELVLNYRGRQDGRWQQWSSSMDATSWVRRVARDIPAPVTTEPEPDRIEVGGAKELKHLVLWCFPEIDD